MLSRGSLTCTDMSQENGKICSSLLPMFSVILVICSTYPPVPRAFVSLTCGCLVGLFRPPCHQSIILSRISRFSSAKRLDSSVETANAGQRLEQWHQKSLEPGAKACWRASLAEAQQDARDLPGRSLGTSSQALAVIMTNDVHHPQQRHKRWLLALCPSASG